MPSYTQQEYGYNVSLLYVSGKEAQEIKYESIKYIVIDYDYDTKNMPVIFINLNIDKAIMDKMLLNDQKDYVTLEINKVLKNSPTKIPEQYIKDRFFYFIPSDPNYTKDIEYIDDDTNKPVSSTSQYREIVIGLVKVDHININKRTLFGTWKNSTLINIICYYTYQMPMLIEPINNILFNDLIVPPCTSISTALEFLNRVHCFYDTPYRYFIDFNRTYLVSSSGKATLAKGETIKSIIFRATDTSDEEGKMEGQLFDSVNQSYAVNVDATQTSIYKDRITDKSFTHISGVGVSGGFIELPLNMNNSELSNKKIKVERVPNDNLKYINHIKRSIEGHAAILQINKTNIDSSIININKKYSVENFKTYNNLNGDFLLSRKREIYLPDGELFIMNTIINLRKIMS